MRVTCVRTSSTRESLGGSCRAVCATSPFGVEHLCRYNARGEKLSSSDQASSDAVSPERTFPSIRRRSTTDMLRASPKTSVLDQLRQDALEAAAAELGLKSLPVPHANASSRLLSPVGLLDHSGYRAAMPPMPAPAQEGVEIRRRASESAKTSSLALHPKRCTAGSLATRGPLKSQERTAKLSRKQMDRNWDAL